METNSDKIALKATKVVDSCKTLTQMMVAVRYVNLASVHLSERQSSLLSHRWTNKLEGVKWIG